MIPEVSINLDKGMDLKSSFLGFNLKYPIGLGPGIDLMGNGLHNLNKLGFEFVEVGPLLDSMENSSKPKLYYTNDNKGKNIKFENPENPFSSYFSLPHLQATLMEMNKESKNIILSTNLKLSNKSLNIAPYLSDSLFIKSLQSVFHISDIITLNLSSYESKAILQYKNMKKFETLLAKVKDAIHYEMGIKAIINYESFLPYKENEMKILDLLKLQLPNTLIKFNRAKIFLRFDNKISNEEIKQYVDICKKSGIVDGFTVGGMTKIDGRGCYVAGESSREESLKILKEFYNHTKGEFALISTGGVLNGEDVFERIKNGANLVLIYSPFIINGPYCLEKIVTELEEKMKKEGKQTIQSIKE